MNTRGVNRSASPVCQPALDVTQCAICLQTNDAASEVQLPCKHKFHGTCIVRHLLHDPRGRCPMCRWEPPRKKQHVDSQAHDDMWKEFAFSRFARMANLWRAVQNLSELDHMWKSIYREQLAAEHELPEAEVPKHTSCINEYTFTIEIRRGENAEVDAGKVEVSWSGAVEEFPYDLNSELPSFRLWDPDDPPAWVQDAISNDVDHGVRLTRLANLDLLFNLWVSKAVSTGNGDITLRTIRLATDAIFDDLDDEDETEFEITELKDDANGSLSNSGRVVSASVARKWSDILACHHRSTSSRL